LKRNTNSSKKNERDSYFLSNRQRFPKKKINFLYFLYFNPSTLKRNKNKNVDVVVAVGGPPPGIKEFRLFFNFSFRKNFKK